MEIEVNGVSQHLDANQNLKNLIDKTVSDTRGMAVAVNNMVIPQNLWDQTSLTENDKVLLIKATQGG